MASLKATQQKAIVAGGVSKLRVTPFTPAFVKASASRSAVVAKAAAVEEDLDFSLSDARKNNEYSTSDVEAAIRFYEDGEGVSPAFDADFVTNMFGMEDASFFDDIDHEEGYQDEYIVAGIPEAAPKKRGKGRGKNAAQEEEDDLEQAKALDKVKALEDRMVLEAAMEEEFGGASGSNALSASSSKSEGVWDWLLDADSTEDAKDMQAKTEQAHDAQVSSDIALGLKPELFEGTDLMGYQEFFAPDDLDEDALAAVEESDEPPAVETASPITEEDLARIDNLLAEEIPILDLPAVAGGSGVPRLEDAPELDRALVDQYIASLRAAVSGGAGASEEEIKEVFGSDEPLTVEAADEEEDAAAQKETSTLLEHPEPKIEAVDISFDAEVEALQDTANDAEDDDGGLEREIRSLQAMDEWREEEFPADDILDNVEGYIVSGEDYVAKEEERKAAIAAAVARGELSPDALAEELEDYSDPVDEMLAERAFDVDEDDDVAPLEEDDGERWVERIIELTRVTKVVKGGKIMGFRCVAIVGNENGLVGVGCQAGREVAVAVKRTLMDAKRNVVRVPLVGAGTVPHRSEAKYHAARCLVLPASDGTGCIAGGSVRSVLELAGVKNCLAKRLGSRSALNSARATVKALTQMQTLNEVAKARGLPMEQLLLQ